jgi:hypothetical protein
METIDRQHFVNISLPIHTKKAEHADKTTMRTRREEGCNMLVCCEACELKHKQIAMSSAKRTA